MGIKLPKSESQVIEDPFLILGYGLNAYFDIMTALAVMCLMITLFISPVLFHYAGNEIEGLKDDPKYAFNQFTIGNLGGSGVYCGQRRIGVGVMKLTCPNGNIVVNDETKFGIMSSEVEQMMHCTEQSIASSFGDTSFTNCTSLMDTSTFRNTLISECDGNSNCTVSISDLISELHNETSTV